MLRQTNLRHAMQRQASTVFSPLILVAIATTPVVADDDLDPVSLPLELEMSVPFSSCGTLDFIPAGEGGTAGSSAGCYIFITHTGGIYTVENVGAFEAGDAVCVDGIIGINCVTTCDLQPTGCIFDNTITNQFSAIGTYNQSFECGVLTTDDGGSYQINGTFSEGLAPGEMIHVTGTLDAECSSVCEMTCIQNAVITEPFAGAGILGAQPGPQGCLLFTADTGDSFLLENTGDFIAGDRVFVSGSLNAESPLCFPILFPGIESNTIDGVFVGCGQIQPGPQSCLTIALDSGGGLLLTDGLFGAGMLDFVMVEGVIRGGAIGCWPFIGTELDLISIDSCLTADVTRDGQIDIDDLIAVILAWGTSDYWADVTHDEMVDVDDLIAVITNYGETL